MNSVKFSLRKRISISSALLLLGRIALSVTDETYSTIFAALKHPIRRRILRMLAQHPHSFMQILGILQIESSHLTYHLDQLGTLIAKTPQGAYRLTMFGTTALNTMQNVEEPPKYSSAFHTSILSTKWLPIVFILIVMCLGLGAVAYDQSHKYSELVSANTQLSHEYSEVMQLLQLVQNDTSMHTEYTLSERLAYDDSTRMFRSDGVGYCFLYNPSANSMLTLAYQLGPIPTTVTHNIQVWLSVQTGNRCDGITLASIPAIWSVNTSQSSMYHVPLPQEGWYTISLHGPVTLERDETERMSGVQTYLPFLETETSWSVWLSTMVTLNANDTSVPFLISSV
jgi:hypothetical protein